MKLLNLSKVRDGKFLKSYQLTYLNNAGNEKVYEIVSHAELDSVEALGKKVSGLSIVAFYEGKLLLLKEFRMGVNREIVNLCAGMMEEGETIEDTLKRELYEETGLSLKRVLHILKPSFAAVSISDMMTQIAIIEADGSIEEHASANEQIKAAFYDKEEVTHLLETREFTSRCQMVAYMYTQGAFDEMLKK